MFGRATTGDEQPTDLAGISLLCACAAVVLAPLALAGLYLVAAPGFTDLQAPAGTGSLGTRLTVTIVTDAGPQKDWPAFEPSSLIIPAGRPVTVTVDNQDGATPLPVALRQHAKVSGVTGNTERVTPLAAAAPYLATGSARSVSAVRLGEVSHTFTVPGLGINVPIPAHARATFTIQVERPGSYGWLCVDPCGEGAAGQGAPMDIRGYMSGTMSVQGS